jgi:tetratricopeptide (TPR) repeat protein
LISKEDGNVSDILKSDGGLTTPFWDLFVKIAHAEYQIEKKHSDVGIQMVNQLESEASSAGGNSNLLIAKLAQMKGDALFQSAHLPEAQKEYRRSLDFLPKGASTFDHAWAHFRTGECSDSESQAFSAFAEASRILDMIEYKNLASRAKGEMAILCYKRKDYKGLLDLIDGITTDYYLNKCYECGPSVVIGLPLVLRLNEELGYPNANLDEKEIDGKILPKFERGIFIRILDLAKPNPGICTAFFTIGLSYQLLNEIDHCIRCFRMSFEATPVVEPDHMAKITAGSLLTNALLLKDGHDLDKVTMGLLTLVELSEKISDPIRISIVFGRTEENLRKGLISRTSFRKLLDHFEQAVRGLEITRKSWWLAEILKRKAGIDSITPEAEYYSKYLRKSWEHALEANNFPLLTEIGHLLGFRFVHEARSVKEVAEIHLSIILGIINDERNIERLETLGRNMLVFWKNIKYRRVAESDLIFLVNLRDSAQRMERQNTPVSFQSPLMILNLLKATGNLQNERFNKAAEWALDKLRDNWEKVPEEERIPFKR